MGRVVHVGEMLNKLINYLKKVRRPSNAKDFAVFLKIDLYKYPQLHEALKKHSRVGHEQGCFWYQPIIGFVRNWTGVLKYLEDHQCGVKEQDVVDAYPAAADHLRRAVQLKQVAILKNSNTRTNMVYPVRKFTNECVSEEVKAAFSQIKVPLDKETLRRKLTSQGLIKKRKRGQVRHLPLLGVRKKPKRKRKRRTKATNSHLFDGVLREKLLNAGFQVG